MKLLLHALLVCGITLTFLFATMYYIAMRGGGELLLISLLAAVVGTISVAIGLGFGVIWYWFRVKRGRPLSVAARNVYLIAIVSVSLVLGLSLLLWGVSELVGMSTP